MKNFIKEWWFIILSFFLMVITQLISPLLLFFLMSITGLKTMAYIIIYTISSLIVAAPILYKIWKSTELSKKKKIFLSIDYVITCGLFLLLPMISFGSHPN